MFVLCFRERDRRSLAKRSQIMKLDAQKSDGSRRFAQSQPRPSGLKVQTAQYIGFRMSLGLNVVFKRASEPGVFRRPVEDLVPVCSENSEEENRQDLAIPT